MSTLLLLALVTGAGVGAMYALVAMGYTIVLASSGTFNLAQSALVALAALIMFSLWTQWHWPALIAIAATCALVAFAGILTYILGVLPLQIGNRVEDITGSTFVTTYALSVGIVSALGLIAGFEKRQVPSYITDAPVMLGKVPVRPMYILMFGVSLAVAVGAEVLLRRSRLGLVLRATATDPEAAKVFGIKTSRVVLAAFACAGLFAAVAGVLIAPVEFASPSTGANLTLFGFAAMAVGGFGSFAGALVGGVLVGEIVYVTPLYMNPELSSTMVYALVLVILLVRPAGLFGTGGAFGAARLREV